MIMSLLLFSIISFSSSSYAQTYKLQLLESLNPSALDSTLDSTSASVYSLSQDHKDSLTIQLSLKEMNYQISSQQKGEYQIISVPGLSLTQTPDNPQVPYLSLVFQGRPEDFTSTIHLGKSIALENFSPSLAPWKPCRCGDKKPPQRIVKKISQEMIQWEYLGDFRGRPLSRLLIFPQTYSSTKKSFRLYPQLQVSLKRKLEIGHKGTTTGSIHPYLNFWSLLKEVPLPPHLLIITPQRFQHVLNPYLQWKQKKGLTVEMVYTEDIGSTFLEIKNYLTERFHSPQSDNKGYSYVLLVGHEQLVPTEYVPTSTNPETPSDLNYFLMGGAGDLIPDVFYGRLPVDHEEELQGLIGRIIDYEKADAGSTNSNDSSNTIAQGVGIASNEGNNPNDEEYLMRMEQPFTSQGNFHFTNFLQDNPESTPTNINRVISQGISWIFYIGHGSGFSWESLNQSPYTADDIKELTPTSTRPIIIDVSCQNGRFLYDGRLGERWINETKEGTQPLGAVAYYGGSVDITWDPPAIMAQEISKAYFSGGLNTLGETVLAGQVNLLSQYSDKQAAAENLVWYHLLGDPTLVIKIKR